MNWREFWNRENSIYVNDRHRSLHNDRIARDIAALVDSPDWTVLDFGCGDASAAATVAGKCRKLYLYDTAPKVQEALRLRYSRQEKIVVLGPEGVAEISNATLDLIVINSVIQYLTRGEFETVLDMLRAKLKPDGRLVIADVLPPQDSAVADTTALLKFASEGGFLVAAGVGLVKTFFSDYRKLRSEVGLTRYDEADMRALLAAHGFTGTRAPQNIGHNQSRMLFVARPAPGSTAAA